MVIFDVAASFIAGGAIGARSAGTRKDLALIAGGLGMGVPGLIFLEAYPHWDWQYLVDPSTLPKGIPAAFVAAILIASLLGHWIGARSTKLVWGAFIGFLVYVGAFWHQTLYVGTLAEYTAGTAPFLPDDFLQLLLYFGPVGFVVIGICLLRSGNEAGG